MELMNDDIVNYEIVCYEFIKNSQKNPLKCFALSPNRSPNFCNFESTSDNSDSAKIQNCFHRSSYGVPKFSVEISLR